MNQITGKRLMSSASRILVSNNSHYGGGFGRSADLTYNLQLALSVLGTPFIFFSADVQVMKSLSVSPIFWICRRPVGTVVSTAELVFE